MTREDHTRVPEQVYANYAIGHDTKAMRTVVGEEALSDDDHKYLEMLDTFEAKFLSHDSYENRDFNTSSGCHDNHCLELKRHCTDARRQSHCI